MQEDIEQQHLPQQQEILHVSESELDAPRSASAMSSLDPYYFGLSNTPPESPLLTLPNPNLLPRTPDMGPSPSSEPITPGKDPAAIDRRGLVGVGELTTPRWSRGHQKHRTASHAHKEDADIEEQVDEEDDDDENDEEQRDQDDLDVDGVEVDLPPLPSVDDIEQDLPDSPWTIEAIDGEPEESIKVSSF